MPEETFAERMARVREEREDAGVTVVVDHNLLKKAVADPTSRAKAMRAMCFQCMGGTIDSLPDPGWKRLIGTCTAKQCALYPWRPYQNMVDSADENETGD